MKDNNITMANGNEVCINTTGDCSTCMIPKVGHCTHERYREYLKKKGGEVSAYAFTKAENTLEITLKVNPEKLIGKTYKEMTELLLKAVIGSNVSIEGERPFPMECGKFYDINQDAIIKRASVDEFDGLIVALDVPFIQTDNPTLDSICAPELPEDDDEDMVKSDDSYYAHLEYSLDEGVYKTPNGITVTSEELMESEVTFIGSDPMGDFEVPALWIIPNDVWYEKQKHIEK